VRDQYTTVPPSAHPAVFRAFEDHEEIIPIPAPEPVHHFFILDEFTNGEELLCCVQPQEGSQYNAVIDARGAVRGRFPHEWESLPDGTFRSLYVPQSVHSSGRWFAGISSVDDGHYVYEGDLFLGDARDAWVAPIGDSSDAWEAHLSREGDWLAYAGLDDGLIHVGTIEITHQDGSR
jgi:hypothetical protein